MTVNVLTALANRFGSDKGDQVHGRHGYTEVYDRLFLSRRFEALTFLEIGLLHPFDTKGPGTMAPSLEMWRAYFPNARLFGFDLNDFKAVSIPGCHIFQGDMGSRDDLLRMARSIGGEIDIIIEDASHASHHQQITLATLFPFVANDGMYIIEDLHWQPAAMEIRGVPKTRSLFRDFNSGGAMRSPVMTDSECIFLHENIKSIQLFDSRDIYNPDNRDALAILTKRSNAVPQGTS
jgi:hypothetical protein